MSESFYLGLDLSFTGTGIVLLDKDYNQIITRLVTTPSSKQTEERIKYILSEIEEIILEYPLCKVYMEGLSYGSTGQAFLDLAGLHWVTRLFFYEKDITYEVVSPTSLKKYITGKGNVKKNVMLKEVYKKYGIDFNDDNICDSYCLSRFCADVHKEESKKDEI